MLQDLVFRLHPACFQDYPGTVADSSGFCCNILITVESQVWYMYTNLLEKRDVTYVWIHWCIVMKLLSNNSIANSFAEDWLTVLLLKKHAVGGSKQQIRQEYR